MKILPKLHSATGNAGRPSERRAGANKQKEAIFYDSGERSRLWLMLGSSVVLNFVMALLLLVTIAIIAWLATVALRTKVIGIVQHDNGRPTTVIGELSPLHGDATLALLQFNAVHYIDDVFTRSDFAQAEKNKASVLTRTAAGTEAESFVRAKFDEHIANIRHGYVAATHIDCRAEGQWQGPSSKVRFDCYFSLEAKTGADAVDLNVHPARMESHVEIVQSRGTKSPELLYTNPDEVYVTYIDAVPQR